MWTSGSSAEAIYPVLLLYRTTKIPRDVEAATGRRGPIELRAWFGLHNGTSEEKPFAQILPRSSHRPWNECRRCGHR